MRFFGLCIASLLSAAATAEILENGQPRENPYPGQAPVVNVANNSTWKSYPPNAHQLSYKGRWDSKYISWWSAPGLKFGFTGQNLAISFGNYTDAGVLVAYRVDGEDWLFSNLTANTTHQFVTPATIGENVTVPANALQTFEMRVTNWALGVQLAGVSVGCNETLVKIPDYTKRLEVIGDSLSAGQYATYEGLSSYSYGLGAGFGDVEYSITAYPGICLHDSRCYDNMHGQTYQWSHTSDTSYRALQIYGDNPEVWDFSKAPAADIVIMNLGTNDNNTINNITATEFYDSYVQLINEVHSTWPDAQIIVMSLWGGWSPSGNTFVQTAAFIPQIPAVVEHFNGSLSAKADSSSFVHLFNTTGVLQHNDIGPQYHPTDVGHVKLASHLMQYIKLNFGWELAAVGPQVQSHTLYWNDQTSY
ncbi:MAG: hypothetical protein M4579_006725 [Chaenotheca gracillima]|nr:MAG: hypothetical protein M4579_006725 [Chaenotheca gracillima]